MSKLPAIQFYPGDWKRDPGIQSLGYFERGVWMEILFLMHESSERGVLLLNGKPMSEQALANCLGLDKQILTTTLSTLVENGVASRREDGALINRRMVRDEEIRQERIKAGHMGGNPALLKQNPTTPDKQNSTPSSSSSSSSSDLDINIPRATIDEIKKWEGTPYPRLISETIIQLEDRIFIENWRYPELLVWFRNAQFKDPFKALRFAVINVNGNFEKRGENSKDRPAWAYSAIIDWGMRNAQEARKTLNDVKASEARRARAESGTQQSRPKSAIFNPQSRLPPQVSDLVETVAPLLAIPGAK